MKHADRRMRPLLAASLLFIAVGVQAQQLWRPFRPGLIYTYEVPGATTNGHFTTLGVYTLRLDSAYITATGDSAWAFNRVMREIFGYTPGSASALRFRKSRNNLFGQRLLWQPGSSEYTLETVAEGAAQAGATLRLRPRAAVASAWVANAALGINATLTSRSLQTVNGQPDTVATITLSTGPVVRLSRRFGLLEGPQWLALSNASPQWVATQLPATLAQSPYSPLRLFDLQPSDEIGYSADQGIVMPVACSQTKTLLRVVSRSQSADSLIYTYRAQSRFESFGAPGCTPASITYTSVGTGRWAFSLTTGRSRQFVDLPMLTGEYRISSTSSVSMSRGFIQLQPGGGGCSGNQLLAYEQQFDTGPLNGNGTFGPIPDLDTFSFYSVPLGLGLVSRGGGYYIAYYRRTRNGTTTTCGSPQDFVNLLPTRAAQAAAVATLAPNPAAEVATLALAQPARPGHTLRLTDALGHTVWSMPVTAGQSAIVVPLAGRAAGLYLLHLSGPDASATWKLTRE